MVDSWCVARRHDTYTAYLNGCRCTRARAENAARQTAKRWDPRPRVPVLGAQRRLQALAAAGWPIRHLSAMSGLAVSRITGWQRGYHPTVNQASARAVARLYDALETTDGPSERTRRASARRGWLGPEWWAEVDIDDPRANPALPVIDCDEVVVARLIAGDFNPCRASQLELRTAVHQMLTERGMTVTETAARLGLRRKQVDYIWLKCRETGAPARRTA